MYTDLFNAILAMDSYNRGYNQGLLGLSDTGEIGDATNPKAIDSAGHTAKDHLAKNELINDADRKTVEILLQK